MANQPRATLREVPPLTVIDLEGEVTTFAEEVITAAYRQASARGAQHILLNFASVDYLNSAGVAVVIGLLMEARKADQQILVTGLTPHYQKIFRMMGLTQYAPLVESEAAARAHAAGSPQQNDSGGER
jgi:anti-anti-sigma factor